MRYSQLARTAVQAVFGNGLRSALTMLGLVIGISSVIILVGIGDGTNRQVSEKMKALGGDALSAYLFDGDMGYNDLSGMNDLGAVDGVAPSKSLMKKLSVGTTVANKAFARPTARSAAPSSSTAMSSPWSACCRTRASRWASTRATWRSFPSPLP